MGVFAGPKIPVKDLCLVADAQNSKIVNDNDLETLTNIVESSNNLPTPGNPIVVDNDETAGRCFSLANGNYMIQSNWTPTINKYNFSIIWWIKRTTGKNGNYNRVWETETTDNPAFGYYFSSDTRLVGQEYIHTYVKNYDTNSWAATTPINETTWENSTTFFQLAITVAQESEYKHYLNGKLSGTIATTNQDLSSYGNIDQIQIGNTGNVGCKMGYFSVYRRALTATEIEENFEAMRARFNI